MSVFYVTSRTADNSCESCSQFDLLPFICLGAPASGSVRTEPTDLSATASTDAPRCGGECFKITVTIHPDSILLTIRLLTRSPSHILTGDRPISAPGDDVLVDAATASETIDALDWPVALRKPPWSRAESQLALAGLCVAPGSVADSEQARLQRGAIAAFQRMALGAALLDTSDGFDRIGMADDIEVLRSSIAALRGGLRAVDVSHAATVEEARAKRRGRAFWKDVSAPAAQAALGRAETVGLVQGWRSEAMRNRAIVGAPSPEELAQVRRAAERAQLHARRVLTIEYATAARLEKTKQQREQVRAITAPLSSAKTAASTAASTFRHLAAPPPSLHSPPSSSFFCQDCRYIPCESFSQFKLT